MNISASVTVTPSLSCTCSHTRSRSETWLNQREDFSLQLGNSLHSLWEFGVSCRFRLLTVLGYSNTLTDWKLHWGHVRAFHPADITCFYRTDWKRQQRDGFIDANRVSLSVPPSGERSCLSPVLISVMIESVAAGLKSSLFIEALKAPYLAQGHSDRSLWWKKKEINLFLFFFTRRPSQFPECWISLVSDNVFSLLPNYPSALFS